MLRTKRLWHAGLLFLVYSCLYVYSDKVQTDKESPSHVPSVVPSKSHEKSTTTAQPTFKKDMLQVVSSTTATNATTLATTEPTTPQAHHVHPTWRPKRTNCSPPAIEQFPKPIMGPYIRKHGGNIPSCNLLINLPFIIHPLPPTPFPGLIVHVLVAVFTFLGLAIVCDDYFVASLDRICEELKLSPDIAGASFMAAGSSAPELATVIIGVFFAKDDIGVSGVIGSAVFNIMFVISCCALCTGTVCQLNWWPLVRDCFFYAVSILVMLFVIINDTISWVEALIMLICYVFYCIALHYNDHLEKWAHSLNLPFKLPSKDEQSSLVTYKNVPEPPVSYNTQGNTNPTSPVKAAPPPAYDRKWNCGWGSISRCNWIPFQNYITM